MLDGAGNPWVRADVGISKGSIAKLGLVTGKGRREIDAGGRYVSPGWIDMMDHSGEVLLESPAAENKLRMGVTTLIGGEGGTPVPAESISIYFARLEKQGIAVNFGSYYSAAQARVHVMGDGAGTPTPAQLAKMKSDVALAMQAGALGISSALIYPPDSYQSTADLIELAKVVSPCGGFYATHMRDESENVVSGIREAVEIGEKGGVKVEIFHLKAAFAPGWGRLMPQALAEIDSARGTRRRRGRGSLSLSGRRDRPQHHGAQLGLCRRRGEGLRPPPRPGGARAAQARGGGRIPARLVQPGAGVGRLGPRRAGQSLQPEVRRLPDEEHRGHRHALWAGIPPMWPGTSCSRPCPTGRWRSSS